MRTAPLGAGTGACHRFHDIVVQLSHSVVLQCIYFIESQLQFPTSLIQQCAAVPLLCCSCGYLLYYPISLDERMLVSIQTVELIGSINAGTSGVFGNFKMIGLFDAGMTMIVITSSELAHDSSLRKDFIVGSRTCME